MRVRGMKQPPEASTRAVLDHRGDESPAETSPPMLRQHEDVGQVRQRHSVGDGPGEAHHVPGGAGVAADDPPGRVDLQMPGLTGLEVQRILAGARVRFPTIIITAHDETETRARCLSAGAAAYLCKPLHDEMLLDAIAEAVGRPVP